ncbi:hypothetical protein GC173_10940 [bacterium]|nr:hypothetical protein [bacterium]
MRVRKALVLALLAGAIGAPGALNAAYKTPTIDGAGISAANNGPSLAVQTATAGFGDTLQLGELLVANDGTNLYVSIPGDNENGGSGIYLFIDSITGGAASLATGPTGGYGEFDVLGDTGGANMPASFNCDFVLNLKAPADGGSIGTWELAGNTASYRGNTGAYTGGFNAAQDNSNTTAAPWATGTVSTGVELVIPLSAIGSPAIGTNIKLFAVSGNTFGGGANNTNYLSNQILPNSGTPSNFGRDGAGGGDGVGTSYNGTGGPTVTPATYQVKAYGVPYSATGAGTSTIGTGGTYATLKAAVDAINAAGSRDGSTWTFEFISNTTEPTNCSIAIPVDAAGKILFKPAAGVSPTVTFTIAADSNLGPSGHFLIGAAADTNWPAASLGTKNIEIDGNNGTVNYALTFTNTAVNVSNQALVVFAADADNCTIKNCTLTNIMTGAANSSGVTLRPRLSGANNLTPDNILIENNIITSTAPSQGVGVNITNSGTLTAGNAARNFIVRNNTITARIRGVFVNFGDSYTIEGNRITVTGNTGFDTVGILNNSSNTPPANTTIIRNNRIFVENPSTLAVANGPTGLFLGSFGSGYDRIVQVYNNEIAVRNTGDRTAGTAFATRGIHMTSGITWRVWNNTIWVMDNPNDADAGAITNLHGIGGFAVGASNVEILNNVIIAEEPNLAAISRNVAIAGVGSGWVSNYNTIYATNSATVGKVLTTPATDLAAWRTASGGDAQSDSFDPRPDFVDSTLPGIDLKLTAATRGALTWAGTSVATVTTDFEGDTRATPRYRGFDERAEAFTLSATTPSPSLPSNTIAENSANATVVGALASNDPDAGDSVIYTLVNNGGGAFGLSGSNIVVANSALLNYESATSIGIQVSGLDESFQTSTQSITINITDVNEAPTDLAISAATVAENVSTGTVVGTLSSTDVDAGDSHVYTLATGTGDTNNGLFTIVGNELRTNAALDFETLGASLSVRIQTQDQNGTGLTYAEAVAITLTNVDEDTDGDGVLDSVEGADFNNAQATTFVSAVTAQALRLTVDAGTLTGVASAASPGSEPVGVTLPNGIVSFNVTGLTNGQSVVVTLTFPNDATINKAYKVNGTTYTEIAGATVNATSISYTVTDGGALDADGTANGTIVDPVAPVVSTVSVGDWMSLQD